MKLNVQTVGLILLSLFLLFFLHDSCNKRDQEKHFIQIQKALNAKVDTLTNENGQHKATILSMQATEKELKSIHMQDSLAMRIQRNVTSSTTAAVSFDGITHRIDNSVTKVAFNDTLQALHTPCDTIYPEYESTVIGPWDTIHVWAGRNKTTVEYVILNEYDIRQYFQGTGFLHLRKEAFAEVINLNPNSKTIGVKSFQLEKSKPRIGIWVVAGAIIAEGIRIALKH